MLHKGPIVQSHTATLWNTDVCIHGGQGNELRPWTITVSKPSASYGRKIRGRTQQTEALVILMRVISSELSQMYDPVGLFLVLFYSIQIYPYTISYVMRQRLSALGGMTPVLGWNVRMQRGKKNLTCLSNGKDIHGKPLGA